MANQQHIDWLLEGVEAWNARRERDDFIPDFLGADIHGAFRAAYKLALIGYLDLGEVNFEEANLTASNLDGADLREANLKGASLREASLYEAILRRADLSEVNLASADLRIADLRESNLRGTVLGKADLHGANVWTFVPPIAGIKEGDIADPTDLSQTIGLTQQQVDSMDGDHSTILPDHITRPAYCPEIVTGIDSKQHDLSGETESKLASPSPALRQQVAFLLRVAPSAAATALDTASQIELAVSEARMNAPDEPALFLQVATALKTLGNALKQADDKDIEIAKLEAIVAQQKQEMDASPP